MAGPGALAVKAALGHGLCGAVLELGGVVVHIQLAGDHAVVHLAALVGPLAVVVFKIHIGSDGVDTGAGVYTTNAIESLNSTYLKLNRQRSVFP